MIGNDILGKRPPMPAPDMGQATAMPTGGGPSPSQSPAGSTGGFQRSSPPTIPSPNMGQAMGMPQQPTKPGMPSLTAEQ